MQIKNAEKYIQLLMKVLCDNGIISEPEDARELFAKNKIHKNKDGDIVGWIISSEEIKFWDIALLDVDEYAEFKNLNKIIELTTFSYHFQPKRNERLKEYRIDKNQDGVHANPAADSGLNDHLGPENLKLNINKFNLLVSIYIACNYINSDNLYPLYDQNAEYYNSIIGGQEGTY